MSRRSQITKALTAEINKIDGTGDWNSNIYSNAIPRSKFWEDIDDYPTVFVVASDESREYLPGNFKWAFLEVSIKVFVKDEDDTFSPLEKIIEDIEYILDTNGVLSYGDNDETTEDIRILSISTDEGVLMPIGVAEIRIVIQYDLQSPCQ